MKTRQALIMFFITGFILVEIFSTHKLSSERVQPPAGYANNPPLNQNCTFCHAGVPIHDSTAFLLSIGPDTTHLVSFTSGVTTYTPNQTYYLRVEGTHIRPVYGFELTADDASGNGQDVGTFILLDPTNTTLSVTGSIGNYVAHHNATQNHQWTFQWTAPASDIGPITFYWAGNDANGIDTTPPAGDSIYLAQKTISVTPGAAINSISNELQDVKIFPNVCYNNFQLDFELVNNKNVLGQVITLDGRIASTVLNEALNSGNYRRSIDVSNLASGIYLLKLQVGNAYMVKKFIRQ